MRFRKAIIPVFLASSMIMSQGVFAAGFTAENNVEVDKDKVTELLKKSDVPEDTIKFSSTYLDVLNGLKTSFIGDDDGLEVKESVYDNDVFTFNMDMNEKGFKAVSSLFPSYVIKGSIETAMENAVTALSEQMETPDMSFANEYVQEFTTALTNACVMSEPKEDMYEVKDLVYDTMVELEIDKEAVIEAEKNFVNQLCEDENFIALYQMSHMFGEAPDLEEVMAANDEFMDSETLPDPDLKLYMNTQEESSAYVLKLNEQGSDDNTLLILTMSMGADEDPVVYVDIPSLKVETKATAHVGENIQGRFDCTVDDQYYGATFDMDEAGNKVEVFYNDPDEAILTSNTTLSEEADRDVIDEEGKTVLDVDTLFGDDDFFDKIGGLIEDVTTNGLAYTLNALVEAVPSVADYLPATPEE